MTKFGKIVKSFSSNKVV